MEAVGVGRRAVAVIIDSILLGVVAYAIAAMTGGTTDSGFNLQGGPFFLWLVVALAYYIVMEKTSGATLGKMAMKLRVVKQGGEALDWQASVVRNVLRLIDGLFFYLIAAIVVWVSKGKQRLGDMAAHTIVVRAQTWMPLVILAFCGALAAEEASAAPSLAKIVVSDSQEGPAKTILKPETAKVYVRAELVDIPAGAKIRGDWIAVKTGVAPPNYKVDSAENVVGKGMNKYTFSMSKPTAGWPEGDYRVDFFIDGKPAAKVPFKVAK